jgi:hypothetical protein
MIEENPMNKKEIPVNEPVLNEPDQISLNTEPESMRFKV